MCPIKESDPQMLISSMTETEGPGFSSRTRPSVMESTKSSRGLKPSSGSSGSGSVYLIYVLQLKVSSGESPLIFFSPSCSLSFSQFLSGGNDSRTTLFRGKRTVLRVTSSQVYPEVFWMGGAEHKALGHSRIIFSRTFLLSFFLSAE